MSLRERPAWWRWAVYLAAAILLRRYALGEGSREWRETMGLLKVADAGLGTGLFQRVLGDP